MSKIISVHSGSDISDQYKPNDDLIKELEDALVDARSGKLRSFVGAGMHADGGRHAMFCYHEDEDIYKTTGSVAMLYHEHMERVACAFDTVCDE